MPVLPKLMVGLDEDFLADVLELGRVAGKTGGHAENPPFVPLRQLGEAFLLTREDARHEVLIRG